MGKISIEEEVNKVDLLLDLAKGTLRDIKKMLKEPKYIETMMSDKERELEIKMNEILDGYRQLRKSRED